MTKLSEQGDPIGILRSEHFPLLNYVRKVRNLCEGRAEGERKLRPWGILDQDYIDFCNGSLDAAAYSKAGLAFLMAAEDGHGSPPKGGVHPNFVTGCEHCHGKESMEFSSMIFVNLCVDSEDDPLTTEDPTWQLTPLSVLYDDPDVMTMVSLERIKEVAKDYADTDPHLFINDTALAAMLEKAVVEAKQALGLTAEQQAPVPQDVLAARYDWPHLRGFPR